MGTARGGILNRVCRRHRSRRNVGRLYHDPSFHSFATRPGQLLHGGLDDPGPTKSVRQSTSLHTRQTGFQVGTRLRRCSRRRSSSSTTGFSV